jgi:hypothetical protein
MLDQRVEEHGKDKGILEWFKPPERKTLHPLCVVLLESLERGQREPSERTS